MKNLFAKEVYEESIRRIESLSSETQPRWGKMNCAQMLAHCAEIQEVSNGKELKNTPFIVKLIKGMIRNMVLNDKPYKKGTQTHPQYRRTTYHVFDTEKIRLLTALEQFVNESPEESAKKAHPLFGELTRDEKGWSMYKHLDHHLTQFGV